MARHLVNYGPTLPIAVGIIRPNFVPTQGTVGALQESGIGPYRRKRAFIQMSAVGETPEMAYVWPKRRE